MAYSVEMPELGESVTEGTITQWLKSVGDTVEVDEPLLEVSTDKVDTEIPSPVAGTLLEIKAEEDDTIDVGAVIAIIGEEGESAGSSDASQEKDEPAEEEAPKEEAAEAESDSDDAPAASGDATDVEMPELGESVTEGTITQWLKSVGDTVEVDEPLLEVSTDKVDTEIPSPVAGTLVEVLADEDDTIDVGAVIARIGDGNAKPAASDKKEDPKEELKQEEAPKEEAAEAESDSDDA
ncbi:MAG: biotin/lipoyl-containing protein, partial [Corynebacterium casei]